MKKLIILILTLCICTASCVTAFGGTTTVGMSTEDNGQTWTVAWHTNDNGDIIFNVKTPAGGTGWSKASNGKWVYFENGKITSEGWKAIGGKWYYFQYGQMATGWACYYNQTSGQYTYYYLGQNGLAVTGWQKISGKWYYFNPSTAAMSTGWQKIGGKWYFFYAYENVTQYDARTRQDRIVTYTNPGSDRLTGSMKTGWHGWYYNWYYLDPASGAMVTGYVTINGQSYYFDTSTGALVK